MFREFVVAQKRLEDQLDRDAAIGWHVGRAYIAARSKKGLPDKLKDFLPRRSGVQQTPQQQQTMMEMISARYGLPMRRMRLIRVEPRG